MSGHRETINPQLIVTFVTELSELGQKLQKLTICGNLSHIEDKDGTIMTMVLIFRHGADNETITMMIRIVKTMAISITKVAFENGTIIPHMINKTSKDCIGHNRHCS